MSDLNLDKNDKETLIVLLRGLSRDSFHWAGFDKNLEEAVLGSKVLSLDLPGFGSRVKENSPLSISKISKSVLNKSEIKNFDSYNKRLIIGLSLGGMVALDDVLKNKEKWTHCVLLNASQKSKTPFWRRFNLKKLPSFLFGILFSGKFFEKTAYIATINNPKNLEKEVREWIAHRKDFPFLRRSVLKQLLAGSRFRLKETDRSSVKEVKSIVLTSKADRLVSYKSSEKIAQLLNWPIDHHQSAGHDLTYDDPEWVIKHIKNLLNENN